MATRPSMTEVPPTEERRSRRGCGDRIVQTLQVESIEIPVRVSTGTQPYMCQCTFSYREKSGTLYTHIHVHVHVGFFLFSLEIFSVLVFYVHIQVRMHTHSWNASDTSIYVYTWGSKDLMPVYPHMMAPSVREGPERWKLVLWRRLTGVASSESVSSN